MRRLFPCLLAVLLSVTAVLAHAEQPKLTLLYSANTFGTIRPCPS